MTGRILSQEIITLSHLSPQLIVQVVRHPRRKRLAIAVDPSEGVIIKSPPHIGRKRLTEAIESKLSWITQTQTRLHQATGGSVQRQVQSGEQFELLGEPLILALRETNRKRALVRQSAGQLVIDLPRQADSQAKRQALIRWYRRQAKDILPLRVEHWANQLGVKPSLVQVRDQKRRWGSANSRNEIRLNWRLVQAPFDIIDYVAAHEAAHLIHLNHSRAYWECLGRVMPDYRQRRRELKLTGFRWMW